MAEDGSVQETQFAGGQQSIGATVMAGGQVDPAALRQAEQAVATEWKSGDVILDLYEVRKVTEGFGEDAVEKDYHEGGFGRVYKVWHRGWNIELAVKVPRPQAYNTPAKKENFLKECETWINLGLHPHVATCNYVRELGGIPRVFSEYATAGTLEDWISSGRLYEGGEEAALERILDIAIQFAWGLHHAHEHEGGIIHQDVKPLNLLMMEDGTAKVCDFGLAKARALPLGEDFSGADGGGRTMMITGGGGYTQAYCSPEQLSGEKLTRRTDMWSWGLSVLAMFHGGAVWAKKEMPTGQLAAQIFRTFLEHNNQKEHDEDEAMTGVPLMPEGVVVLLHKCFKKNTNSRPKSMIDCAAALTRIYKKKINSVYPRSKPRSAEIMADGLNNRAISFLDLGKPSEAEKLFDDALRSYPDHPVVTYNRGFMLWNAGKITGERVLESLNNCEQSAPNNPQVALCRGWIEWERADFAAAAKYFRKAVENGGGIEAQSALDKANILVNDSVCYIRTSEQHIHPIMSVCINNDGRWALSGSRDSMMKLWDMETGSCLRTFEGHQILDPMNIGKGGKVLGHGLSIAEKQCADLISIGLSGDGCWALSGHSDGTIQLWDVTKGYIKCTFKRYKERVTSINLSANGNLALSGSSEKVLRLWDINKGRCVRTFGGHANSVCSTYLSRDGRWALSGSDDKTIKLWEVATGRCVRTFEGHRSNVESVCMSIDGRWILSGDSDGILKLWGAVTGYCVRTFEGHTERINSVSLSGDGLWALSGSSDKTLRLWDASTGRCVRAFEGHTKGISSACLKLDGSQALSGSWDGTLRIWKMNRLTGKGRQSAPFVYCRLMTVHEILDARGKIEAEIRRSSTLIKKNFAGAALKSLRKARSLPGGERDNAVLELWREAGRRSRRKGLIAVWPLQTFKGHAWDVISVCLSSDGRLALSGSWGKIKLWDVSTGQCLRTFEGHAKAVNSVCLSADGRWALSGSDDTTLKLWDVSTGQCLRTFEGHAKAVNSVCLSADGRWALSGSDDTTLKLWYVASGQRLQLFEGHAKAVNSVCLSADGRWALSGSDDTTLKLWDVSTGQCLRTFEGHAKAVNSVCLSANGRWALSGSDDMKLRLWDMETGLCARVFKGHTKEITSVCLTADGRWALSGSSDKTLKLWEIDREYPVQPLESSFVQWSKRVEAEAGQSVRTLEGHIGPVTSIIFSDDGCRVLSGSRDKTLRLWELDWDYEPTKMADWDKGARPYLNNFLALSTPYVQELPTDHRRIYREVNLALTRHGRPAWNDDEFLRFLETLANAGFGWLRPEGIRRELERVIQECEKKLYEKKCYELKELKKQNSFWGKLKTFFGGKKR